jgi:hypothetical protein
MSGPLYQSSWGKFKHQSEKCSNLYYRTVFGFQAFFFVMYIDTLKLSVFKTNV